MLKRVLRLTGVTITLVAILVSASITASATNTGFSTLNVNGEAVKIYRDDFGIPHIFAETNRGLFEAYGYTVAQDRLWQLELNRRAARSCAQHQTIRSGSKTDSYFPQLYLCR